MFQLKKSDIFRSMGRHKRRHGEILPWLRFCACLFCWQVCPIYLMAQSDTLSFGVMFYNVENLFDCAHDSLKDDIEFLPQSVRHWNHIRYKRKLDNVARVIVAAGGWDLPALVGLCEVENDSVLIDLTRYSALREAGYRYIMTHSADDRGIDVALLYQRGLFKPLFSQSLVVPKPVKKSRPTRDILHVSGLLLNGDTLDVFVCHFPSRSSGSKVTEPYRLNAAQRVRKAADSIFAVRQKPQILIMGDFNDYPEDKSVRSVLCHEENGPRFFHLLAGKAGRRKDYGSYKFQGWWGLLDHLIVSSNMLDESATLYADTVKADVVTLPFLLLPDKKYGGKQPFRTYYGMRYQGGYSDHLPVKALLRLIY